MLQSLIQSLYLSPCRASFINDLKWDFDGNVRTINRHADSIDFNMENAIKGFGFKE